MLIFDATRRETRPAAVSDPDRDVYVRMGGEFREMPGLTLTLRQAARLFAIEEAQCRRVLAALVRDGVLVTDGFTFARRPNGVWIRPRWRD